MDILHVLPSVDPSSGGTVEGVRQLAVAQVRVGCKIEILTLDDPEAHWVREFPVVVHAIGPGFAKYRWTPKLVPWLRANARAYDAVIVHGLWQYHSLGTWRAIRGSGVPYYVYVHGMLGGWFKREFPLKHLKKWMYWPWAEYRVLRDAQAVLFTCEEERREAERSFWLYKSRPLIIGWGTSGLPDSVGSNDFFRRFPELKDKRIILFLGRLHPIKGCDLLIEAFGRMSVEMDSRLHLVIAGPDPLNQRGSLSRLAEECGVTKRISWIGELWGSLKWNALRSAEVLVLPSHHENFGLVVAEAFSCGCPVLMTDKVNIWREASASGAAFVGNDNVDGVMSVLRRWLLLPEYERDRIQLRARACFLEMFDVQAVALKLRDAVLKGDLRSGPKSSSGS